MEFDDFEKEVSNQEVNSIIILQIALMVGPLFIAIVTIFLNTFSSFETIPLDAMVINILSAVTGFFMFNGVVVYNIAGKVRYSPKFIISMFENEKPIRIFLAQFRGTRILQMAFLEGAALTGIVCYFLGTLSGTASGNILYKLNFLPLLVLLIIGFTTIPTRSYLYNKYKNLESMNELLSTAKK